MTDIVHTETVTHGKRKFSISIMHDQDCPSPLENDEGVFITSNKAARERFGNTPLDHEAHRRIGRRIRMFNDPSEQLAEALRTEDDEDGLSEEPLIGLPVFAYQHSGVALSTRSWQGRAHHAEWDSGQSGFIYITAKTALEWMGGKRLTKRKLEQVYKNLAGMVEEYGRWLNGDCFGYVVTEEGEAKEVDACWGFIGMDYVLGEARGSVKSIVTPRRAA